MGLATLFKGTAEAEDHALLQTVKEARSKSEFARTAPLGLKALAMNSDSPMTTASPRIGTQAAPEELAAGIPQAFASTTGLIFPGDVPELRVMVPLEPAPAPASSSAPKVQYTHSSQFQQQVELYRGSVSTVYRGVCSATLRPVIIKCYIKAKMKPKNFTRMEREIRLMKFLSQSEMMCQFFGSFESDNHKYIIMEHCRGGDLFKFMLMRGGNLPEPWVASQIIIPLLKSLVLMHHHNIIHRDIKPENIFLTGSHRFKMGDLGLAICIAEELPFTRSGTLDYMAPEVLANPSVDLLEGPSVTKEQLKSLGVRPYGPKVDVWAAGVLAYELVVGRAPFEVKDESQTASMIMFSNNIHFPPQYTQLWADFVKTALEKKPTLRPSAEQLLQHPWLLQHAPKKAMPESTSMKQPEPMQIDSPTGKGASMEKAYSAQPGGLALSPKPGAAPHSPSPLGGHASIFAPDAAKLKPMGLIKPEPTSATVAHLQDVKSNGDTGLTFNTLMDRAKAAPQDQHVYMDSGEVSNEQDRAKGGVRIRLKHYFARQKSGISQASSDSPI